VQLVRNHFILQRYHKVAYVKTIPLIVKYVKTIPLTVTCVKTIPLTVTHVKTIPLTAKHVKTIPLIDSYSSGNSAHRITYVRQFGYQSYLR
jgi:hypothetical protein